MSQQINLFNPIFLKQKKYFSAATLAQALGLIFLGCILLAAYASYQVSMLKKESENTSAQLSAQRVQLAKVSAAFASHQKNQTLENDVLKADAEVKSMQQIFDVLQKGELGNTKGYAEYMRAFSRQIVNGVWLTGFSIYGAGNEIGLQGRASQASLVPAYLTRLKREPILHGKSFAMLDMQIPASGPDEKSAPVSYLEFRLLSSAAMNEGADSSGAKSK